MDNIVPGDAGYDYRKFEDKDILTEIATYLTKQFICEPSSLPADECLSEAKVILSKFRNHNWRPPEEWHERVTKAFTKGLAMSEKRLEAKIAEARQEERERIFETLDLGENEMGFCEISNHVPYSALKKGETNE